jgi:hypothetical protein
LTDGLSRYLGSFFTVVIEVDGFDKVFEFLFVDFKIVIFHNFKNCIFELLLLDKAALTLI